MNDEAQQQDRSCTCMKSMLFPFSSEYLFCWSSCVWHRFTLVSIAKHFLNLRNKSEDMFCNICEIPHEGDGIMVDALYSAFKNPSSVYIKLLKDNIGKGCLVIRLNF